MSCTRVLLFKMEINVTEVTQQVLFKEYSYSFEGLLKSTDFIFNAKRKVIFISLLLLLLINHFGMILIFCFTFLQQLRPRIAWIMVIFDKSNNFYGQI